MINELDLRTAAEQARRRGFPGVTAARLADHDLTAYEIDEVTVVAAVRTDPVIDRDEVHLPLVLVAEPGSQALHIVHAVRDVCRHLDVPRAVVALPFRARVGPQLDRAADYLRKPVGTAVPAPDAELCDASEEDWTFVRTMLHLALMTGYSATEPHLSGDELAEMVTRYVEESFDPPDPDQVRAIVAASDGRLVGHATWLAPAPNPITGRSTSLLLDVAALPDHKDRGLRQRLVAAVEARLQGEAVALEGQVVVEGDGKDVRLVDALVADGWQPTYSEFVYTGCDRWGFR